MGYAMNRIGLMSIILIFLLQMCVQAGPDADATAYATSTTGHVHIQHAVGQPDADQTRRQKPEAAETKEASYHDDYAPNECEDGCPRPQPADAVIDAYNRHYTFNWAELAQDLAQARLRSNATQDRRQGAKRAILRRIPHKAGSAKPQPTRQPSTPQQHADVQPVTLAPGQPAAAGAATTDVHPTAVTKKKFLLPTGDRETGEGFQGALSQYIPTDQALAVGPHPTKPDAVMLIHGINSVFEVFAATKAGRQLPLDGPTRVSQDDIMKRMGYPSGSDDAILLSSDPTAFYDKADGRFVVIWTSFFTETETDTSPPLFVCASADNQPLGDWTCWALTSTMDAQPYAGFCAGLPPSAFIPDYPQTSYSDDGIFIHVGGFCGESSFLSALYAFSKKALYSIPPDGNRRAGAADGTAGSTPVVMRATYLPPASWYASLPAKDQQLDFDPTTPTAINPFNTFLLPSRPQTKEDVAEPFFVMGKVDGNRYMSIAKLTGEPLADMTSRNNAPRIYAAVLRKPNFSNNDGFPEGDPVTPQPEDGVPLDAGDVGQYGRTYGATHHNGRVYVATTEFFGVHNTRVPSIYYAIIAPSRGLCKPHIHKSGMVASEDGFALAYPVIAALDDGAVLAYSYGSAGSIELNGVTYPAYAGFAKTVVACKGVQPVIQVVKRGELVVPQYFDLNPLRWGDFSAVDFIDDVAWFAGCAALEDAGDRIGYGSWISTQQL